MLGSLSLRLVLRSRSSSSVTVALPQSQPSSPHSYSAQVIHRHPDSAKLSRNLSRPRPAWSDQHAYTTNAESSPFQAPRSPSKRFRGHSSSCLLAGDGVIGATIWHALLPSRHLPIVDRDVALPLRRAYSFPGSEGTFRCGPILSISGENKRKKSSSSPTSGQLPFKSRVLTVTDRCFSTLNVPCDRTAGMNRRVAMEAGLRDGSWNVAWDVRPARWLHGRHSAWLLFGVCACFSAAAGAAVPNMLTGTPMHAEALAEAQSTAPPESDDRSLAVKASHGKQVYTDYSVTGIPGDGRCLFRAVAHGACLRSGKPAPTESLQRELADDLRDEVVKELVRRREESEWFIEEDFDTYVKRMKQPRVWGGEPELLMASHVLKMPITVYMFEKSSGGLISIAEYGQEYGKEKPIRVLYHGFGHYDALQIPDSGSNLQR